MSGGTVHYETNPTVGSYWSSQAGTGWTVTNSNGTQSPNQNFDFVQNTETFTISDVFNVPSVPTDGSLESDWQQQQHQLPCLASIWGSTAAAI